MPEDRDLALMWAAEQAGSCPTCGTSDWEWTDNPEAWEASPWRCFGCEKRDALRRELIANSTADSDFDGLQIRLFRPTEGGPDGGT